jgi:cyclopropane fatty-acyl-phospholipid synthase-like methyltransferase
MKIINFKEYWANKKTPNNRRDDDEFCQKKINELLLHIKKGGIILDYGCGNCNQTKFLSPYFDRIIAVDFSENMLYEAKKEIELLGIKNIILLHADESTVWSKIDNKIDILISTGVIQYFHSLQLEDFIKKCIENISNNGYIVFCDVIHPLKYLYFKYNLFNNKGKFIDFFMFVITLLICFFFKKESDIYLGDIGYGYYPSYFMDICKKNNLELQIVNSIYYEYRYHVIIQRKIRG